MKTNLKSEDEVEDRHAAAQEETKNAVPKAEGAEDEQDQKNGTVSQNDGNNVSAFGQVLKPVASPSRSECDKLLEKAEFEPEDASQTLPRVVKADDELAGTANNQILFAGTANEEM